MNPIDPATLPKPIVGTIVNTEKMPEKGIVKIDIQTDEGEVKTVYAPMYVAPSV